MAGKIIADTIEASGSQISLNVGNVTILTASSTGLTLTPTSNVNINVTNSTLAFGAGNVSFPSITTSGDTNTGLYFPTADTIGFVEGGTEVMRINSSGNIGIGTTNPTPTNATTSVSKLVVVGSGVNQGIQAVRTVAPGGGGALFLASTTRGSDATSYTALQSGDGIGSLIFTGADGTQQVTSAVIQAQVDGTVSTDNVLGRLTFSTSPGGANAAAERMRIDSSGNVGIGTSSPAVKLHISGGTQRIQSTGSTSNAFLQLQNDVGTQANLGIVSSGNSPSSSFYIETNGGKTVYVDASGNLILRRSAQVNSATMTCSAGQNTRQISFVNNNNNNETGYIFCLNDGTSTQYATTSDYRLKENVTPMTGALSVVAQLKPVTYKWKLNGSDGQGFIAHELQAIVPDCVSGVKDEIEIQKDENGNDKTIPKYQGVDTSYLVATLTAAIQELKVIVDAQAVEIAALKAK